MPGKSCWGGGGGEPAITEMAELELGGGAASELCVHLAGGKGGGGVCYSRALILERGLLDLVLWVLPLPTGAWLIRSFQSSW